MTKRTNQTAPNRLSTAKSLGTAAKPKTETLQKLLSRRRGATIAQVQKQLDWQSHTIRAEVSRLRSSGLLIELDRSGKVARYRVVSGKGQRQ